MIINKIDFKHYCFHYPFSTTLVDELQSTVNTLNPQDFAQTRKLIESAEQLPIKNIQLIMIPNQLTVILYQSLDSDTIVNFGFFESINDQELVNQCFDFIQTQYGDKKQLVGPINFSTFFKYRFKLNCFERSNFLGEPNNLSYYPSLLEGCGFSVDKTYHSQYSSAKALDVILNGELDLKLVEQSKKNFSIKSIDKNSIANYIQDIYELVIAQFKHKSEFNPISFELFESIYIDEILNYIHPRYSFVYYYHGQLAGFNFMFDHKKYATENKLKMSDSCSDLIYKTVCIHEQFQGKGLFKLMNGYTLAQYPHGISTTGATMEDSQFVLNYSDKYGEVQTIDYALYKKHYENN
ncbi:MAG: hypothetical protein HRU38_02380 [Saccharospirillaceae bacterium]|nr:hypothetical protein [Pseudomonadales bacterium]NRB77507.1 hypothetical protein [Saccharospirillaceae bacterium]